MAATRTGGWCECHRLDPVFTLGSINCPAKHRDEWSASPPWAQTRERSLLLLCVRISPGREDGVRNDVRGHEQGVHGAARLDTPAARPPRADQVKEVCASGLTARDGR
eukprot:scaffold5312_cov118-Isochrysis_galbana.AAC.12